MPPLNREKLLAIGFGALILLWFGGGLVSRWVFEPFGERTARLEALHADIARLNDQALLLAQSRKQLADWKVASLPPDRGAVTSKKPDANDAQRLYQAWLTDLTHLAGMEGVTVVPGTRRVINSGKGRSSKPVYITVGMSLETSARFSQLCTFLDYFQRARLLQRVTSIEIDSPQAEGDPLLEIKLDVEGLALIDAPSRTTLFPETTLAAAIDDRATEITVAPAKDFPTKPPFRIRLGAGMTSEYATVTAIDGTTWTITRGTDRTYARAYPERSVVEFAPVKPNVPSWSTEEFREVLAANIFIKPPPPKAYKLKLGPLAEQAFARGETLSYTIPVSDYDPTLGKPEFALRSDPPPGLQLDRGIGKVTWTPAAGQAIGKFPLKLEVKHPSASTGVETAELSIVFREPNSPPTIGAIPPQTVYLGRAWSLPLPLEDAETPVEQLTVKLDNPPAGLSFDPVKRQLTWTPAPPITPGPQTVTVSVTDNGTPPQTATLPLPLKVEDDAAQFTFLVGSIAIDGVWQAWLYNRAADKRTVLRPGDNIQVADIQGTVAEIGKDFVVLKQPTGDQRLELGRNLRELLAPLTAIGGPDRRATVSPAPEAAVPTPSVDPQPQEPQPPEASQKPASPQLR